MRTRRKLMNNAWVLQHRLDARIHRIRPLSFEEYLRFMGVVFFLTGLLLSLFCSSKGVNPLMLDMMSSPLQYIGLGLICLLVLFSVRRYQGSYVVRYARHNPRNGRLVVYRVRKYLLIFVFICSYFFLVMYLPIFR